MKSLNNSITASYFLKNTQAVRPGLIIILLVVLGLSFIASSSANRNGKGRDTLASGNAKSVAPIGLLSVVMPEPAPTPAGPESIATYNADCETANTHFTVDADTHNVTVCARADNLDPLAGSRKIYWVNPAGSVVQIDDVSPTSPSATRVISALGNWKAYLVDGADGSARAIYSFTVSDAAVPKVDLSVFKTKNSGDVTSGGFITYQIIATNHGPDTASGVQLTDTFPEEIIYSSSSQDSGPTFIRTQETPTTIWTIDSFAPGASATFTFVFQVNSAAGTTISNTVNINDVTNGTDELSPNDNTWTASDTVGTGGGGSTCSLDCPNNVTASATTHGEGGGAIVDYAAPEAFGTCGTVEFSQDSHTFFPIGETEVTASATGGGSCVFTITVIDSDPPVITSCPGNITVTANSGESQAFVPDTDGTSSDPGLPTATGDNVVVTGGRSDGEGLAAAYPLGVTTITWTATECTDPPLCENPNVRSVSCEQTITVLDPDPLTITCPTDKTFNASGCSFTATAAQIGTPTTTGVLATPEPGETNPSAVRSDHLALTDPFPAGTTAITWTATRAGNGSTTSCTQIITVVAGGGSHPVLTIPPDVNVTTSTCSALLDDELGVATATDTCSSSVSITRTGVPRVPCPTPLEPLRTCESFVFPTGTTNVTYTATNSAGLTTTLVQHVTVTESPAVPPAISCPANITVSLPLNTTATSMVVNYTTPVGTDDCAGATTTQTTGLASGALFPVGTTTNTFRVTDASGNFTECSFTVTVLYDFTGFFSPVGNVPTLNSVNAGRAIPIKFSLSGNKGLNIFAADSPYSVSLDCSTSDPGVDVTETLTAGGSSLSYSSGSDQYNYVWKTESSWAGTCRQLVVKLNDGTIYVANFKFK